MVLWRHFQLLAWPVTQISMDAIIRNSETGLVAAIVIFASLLYAAVWIVENISFGFIGLPLGQPPIVTFFEKLSRCLIKIEICASCIQKNACLECHKLTWTRPTLSERSQYVILTLSICIADPYSQTEGALAFIIRSCGRDRKKEHGVKYRTNNRSLKMNVNYGAYRML